MHGADSDVLWLQRDFGLFPVGLLDTGQAARVLELPGFGLAHLLQHYCDFKASRLISLRNNDLLR
jgi:exosome complex exonuclease RRP6